MAQGAGSDTGGHGSGLNRMIDRVAREVSQRIRHGRPDPEYRAANIEEPGVAEPTAGHEFLTKEDLMTDRDETQIDNTEELELANEDERLPWLESADYDEEEPGTDTGKIIAFVLLALVALALLIGGIWWLSNRGSDSDLVAEGGTLAAPEGDYKERPEDRGGREFEGAGDSAPAVGEGQSREGRLANSNTNAGSTGESDARPSIDRNQSGERQTPASDNAASGGVGVQVAAYSTPAGAERGWQVLSRQTDVLKGVKYRVVKGEIDRGTVYRLQAVTSSTAAARKLCDALKADGLPCQVKS
ncbi:hypothetical protein HME9302_00494 [Alteripontixanthobacter maritimus]|uniref:SPOR domain-containing protein n=1 Tax=Alteripontixanthobacter maritimus TaxID=2161824 RepID=A0A369Q7P6_9SPHN|nr:SPOR domain-containing protein [Alteripontixanthobacter maritimus]RDC59307.1 hypothetical protein HME9302_00494 [Alteripontixanthobacter maritimus]